MILLLLQWVAAFKKACHNIWSSSWSWYFWGPWKRPVTIVYSQKKVHSCCLESLHRFQNGKEIPYNSLGDWISFSFCVPANIQMCPFDCIPGHCSKHLPSYVKEAMDHWTTNVGSSRKLESATSWVSWQRKMSRVLVFSNSKVKELTKMCT